MWKAGKKKEVRGGGEGGGEGGGGGGEGGGRRIEEKAEEKHLLFPMLQALF